MTDEPANPYSQFDFWWYNVGSGIGVLHGEDYEEHAHRVAREAWSAARVDFIPEAKVPPPATLNPDEYWERCDVRQAEQHRYRSLTGSIGLEGPWSDWLPGLPSRLDMRNQYQFRRRVPGPIEAISNAGMFPKEGAGEKVSPNDGGWVPCDRSEAEQYRWRARWKRGEPFTEWSPWARCEPTSLINRKENKCQFRRWVENAEVPGRAPDAGQSPEAQEKKP